MPKVVGWPRARSSERLELRSAWGPGKQPLEHSPTPSPCGLVLLGRLGLAKKSTLLNVLLTSSDVSCQGCLQGGECPLRRGCRRTMWRVGLPLKADPALRGRVLLSSL